jgi:hypothetical protein
VPKLGPYPKFFRGERASYKLQILDNGRVTDETAICTVLVQHGSTVEVDMFHPVSGHVKKVVWARELRRG